MTFWWGLLFCAIAAWGLFVFFMAEREAPEEMSRRVADNRFALRFLTVVLVVGMALIVA